MTPADAAGGDPAGRTSEPPRRLAPPPPQYEASDEISLDEPSAEAMNPAVPPLQPTLRGSGPEPSDAPTSAGARVGRPVWMLWLWVAPNSSAAGFITGATLFSFGMSVRQVIFAALAGALVSSVLLVLGVVAGRDDGVPGEFASRASFGDIGRQIVSAVVLVVRILWGAVLLWVFATVLTGVIGVPAFTPVLLVLGIALSGGVAALGYRTVLLLQAGVAVIGSIAVVSVVAGSATGVDLPVAFGIGDGPAGLVFGGIVIVLSIGALTVLPGASTLGRYQAVGSRGRTAATALWCTLGSLIPVLVVVPWGAILAGGDPVQAGALVSAPADGLAALLPAWARVLLAAAVGLGLLSALSLAIYSGGFALQATGLPLQRMPSALATAGAVLAVSIPVTVVSLDPVTVLRDLLPTLAVPVVALSGVLGARVVRRRRGTASGDDRVERPVRWFELTVLAAAVTVGYGLTSGAPGWLSWQGYLFSAVGGSVDGALAASDPGVVVALLIGGLAVFSGSGRMRRPSHGGSHRVDPERTHRAR